MKAPASYRAFKRTNTALNDAARMETAMPEHRFSNKMQSLWLEAKNKFDTWNWMFDTVEKFKEDTGVSLSLHDAALYLSLKHGDTSPQTLNDEAHDIDKLMEYRKWYHQQLALGHSPPSVLRISDEGRKTLTARGIYSKRKRSTQHRADAKQTRRLRR